MQVAVPVISILLKLGPIIRTAVREIVAATKASSPGGKKITDDEWEDIGIAVGLRLGKKVVQEVRAKNKDL